MEDLPKMNDTFDLYLNEKVDKLEITEQSRVHNVRTTDYTISNFAASKHTRLWSMKMNGQYIDSLICTTNNYQEAVHMDLILALNPKTGNFFQLVPQDSTSSTSVQKFIVDSFITSALLKEIIYYAYNRKCTLTEQNSVSIADFAAKYGIDSLVQYCLDYLMNHVSVNNVIKGFELADMDRFVNVTARTFFQSFIEDHLEQIWTENQNNILNMNLKTIETILRWDKLNIQNERIVWHIIVSWTRYNLTERLGHLPHLMKNCFRFGRISEPNLQEIVFKNELFRSLPSGQQSEMEQFINHVLHGETRNQTVIDGHGLLYAKPIFYFRPRETRQFLIAAGGWIEGRTTSSIELYDYQLNMWLSTPFKLPSVVSYFGFEAIDSTIYVFGGSNGREIFKELKGLNLSCKESKWQNKCSMIERRCYVSSVVLDGRIYAIGGFNQQRRIRKCEKYCPQLDCWTEIADLHYARSDASSATYGGRIFIAGGINDTNIEQSVEVYYPDGNYWLIVKSMATPRTSFAMTCYSDRIWAIGGNDGHRRLNSVESYDPVLNIWRQERPMINSRSTFRAISFNDELVVVGGYNGENPVRSVEKFNPKKGWLKVRPLLHERSGLSLITIPNNFDLFHH